MYRNWSDSFNVLVLLVEEKMHEQLSDSSFTLVLTGILNRKINQFQ